MRALAGAAAVILLVLGCSWGGGTVARPHPASAASHSTSPTVGGVEPFAPPADDQAVPGGCGASQAYQGPVPDWLDQAAGHNVPRFLPYVIAMPALAGGFLFGYPLRAGHPTNPANKILWVVRTPRNGVALRIDGHPVNASTPTARATSEANSGPGEIYPSIVDVPTPGCWHLALTWATGRAEVDLDYQAS